MRGRPWSPDDDSRLRRLVAAGLTDGEIGREMGRHPKCVGRRRREMDIGPGASPESRSALARLNMRRLHRVLDFQSISVT